MKCASCSTPMQLSKSESSDLSSAEWYSCPCCGRSRLTTRRRAMSDADAAQVDGLSGYNLSGKLSSFASV